MLRAALSIFLCACAFGLGMWTVCLAARNRSRASELDGRHRWCEVFSRQNELLKVHIEEQEWRLLGGEGEQAFMPEVER